MEISSKLQTEILSMPDDCLGLILKLIPLENLIHLRRVCHRFDVISKVVLRSKRYLKLARCQVQRSHCAHYPVKNLFAERPLQDCRDDHVLLVPEDGGQGEHIDSCLQQIAQLLPNIRQLVVFTGRHTSSVRFELPAQLLPKWSTNLISLTIIQWSENSENGKHESALDRLLLATNYLICLKELNLLFFDSLTPSFKSTNQFPVLGQLEQFTLHNFEDNLEPILSQLGGEIRHLRVQLSNQDPEIKWNKFGFAQFNHNFSTSLTHLSFGTEILQTKSLANLNSLTYLDLSTVDFDNVNYEITDPDLFVEISKMKFLVELRLNIILLRIYFEKQQIVQQPNENQIKYPHLPSIRHLRLRGHEQHFYNFTKYYSTLAQMFNSVKELFAIKYCSKSMGLPTAEQADQFTNRNRKYFGAHFSQNEVQLNVEFELNRNVLHYVASNLDFEELLESLSSHDTDRYMHEHNPKGVDDETTSEEDDEEEYEDETEDDS